MYPSPYGNYTSQPGRQPAYLQHQQQQQLPQQQQQLDRRLEYRGGYSYLAANESRRADNQRLAELERQNFEAYTAAHRPHAFSQSLGGSGSSGGIGDGRVPDRRAFLKRKEDEMRQRQMAKYARATAGHPVPAGFTSEGRKLAENVADGPVQPPLQQQQQMRQANAAFLDRLSTDNSTASKTKRL